MKHFGVFVFFGGGKRPCLETSISTHLGKNKSKQFLAGCKPEALVSGEPKNFLQKILLGLQEDWFLLLLPFLPVPGICCYLRQYPFPFPAATVLIFV